MIIVNEKELTIEQKNTLSFDKNVKPIYEEIVDSVQYDIEYDSDEFEKVKLESMKKFVDYELTNEDMITILNNIKDDYEYELYHSDYEVTLFDQDGIVKGIKDWIKDTFDLEI